MLSFLKIIRYKNLLIIAATQYMMRYFIIKPILHVNNFELQLDHLHFLLLVLSTMAITAAGYVINDYFDTKTDMLNRPETVLVGKFVSRRIAMFWHIILNTIGVGLGIYLSIKINLITLSVAYILAAGILWFYSTTYKRQFLVGNLIVSVFTAMVPFVVVLFEVPLLNEQYRNILLAYKINFNSILAWVGGFSFFAFLSTLIREIIKDIEDYEGDMAFGRNTLPIVLGIRGTKIITGILIVFTMTAIIYVYLKYLLYSMDGKIDLSSMIYFIAFLIIPFGYLLVKIITARIKDEYHYCSNLTKIIMLTGILYSVIAFWIITKSYI